MIEKIQEPMALKVSSNSTGSSSDSNDGSSGGDVTATEGSDNKALPIEITEDEN